MSKIVGIDLGTTNSLVATVDSGIPFVIADADGQRLTPSVVHFPAANSEPVVGHEANRVRVLKPAETVYSVKRFMGRRGAEISDEEKSVTYPVQCRKCRRGDDSDSRQKLFAGGNLRRNPEKTEARRGKLFRRTRHARGHHRAGVFQRRAAQRHQDARANWPASPSSASSTSRPPPRWPTVWTS